MRLQLGWGSAGGGAALAGSGATAARAGSGVAAGSARLGAGHGGRGMRDSAARVAGVQLARERGDGVGQLVGEAAGARAERLDARGARGGLGVDLQARGGEVAAHLLLGAAAVLGDRLLGRARLALGCVHDRLDVRGEVRAEPASCRSGVLSGGGAPMPFAPSMTAAAAKAQRRGGFLARHAPADLVGSRAPNLLRARGRAGDPHAFPRGESRPGGRVAHRASPTANPAGTALRCDP